MTDDERAIREMQAAWFEATMQGDLPRLLTMMADDVVFLTSGRPPFGRDEFAQSFEAGRARVRLQCEGEFEEVVVIGDVAHARGRLSVTVTPIAGGEVKRLAGYALSIFRKQPDGRWILSRDANLLT